MRSFADRHSQILKRALGIGIVEIVIQAEDPIKLQAYPTVTMTLNARGGSFEINDPNSLWSGANLHDLYKKAYTPWEWHAPIMERDRELWLIR